MAGRRAIMQTGRVAVPVFRRRAVALGIWTGFVMALNAGVALAATDPCSETPPGEVRQDCLTAAALPRPGDGDLTRDDLGAPVTAPLSADAFRHVTRDDLAADPAGALRRPIAVSAARCFSFGVGDDRCILRGAVPVAVATAIVIPPEAALAVERGCGVDDALGCTHRILFVPASFREVNIAGAPVLVFRTPNVIVAPGEATTQGVRP